MRVFNPTTNQYDWDVGTQMAVEGLMAMGYSVEEALAEIRKNDAERQDEVEAELWNSDPRTGKDW